LRRKALAAALVKKPFSAESVVNLTLALHRYLNKTDQGYEALRKALWEADNGEADIDLLFDLAQDFLANISDAPERNAIGLSLQLLSEITGALTFAGMEREGKVIDQCREWLQSASKAGAVREDDAFRCFADAFAQIELHLQRSVIDPLDDTSHMMAFAEQRAGELDGFIQDLSSGSAVVTSLNIESNNYVRDGVIPPEFREVFIEESVDISTELNSLVETWFLDPEVGETLKDIRRHFHTFKGNGRAVGANTLGELGWAAQDMLDRVIEGEIKPDDKLQALVGDVVRALPDLVASFGTIEGFNMPVTRELTNRCFLLANSSGEDIAKDLQDFDTEIPSQAPVLEELTATQTIGQ
jgi:hypothetical protein